MRHAHHALAEALRLKPADAAAPLTSDCSLPTMSRHLCSVVAPSSLAFSFVAACDGTANATRESTSTIVLISISVFVSTPGETRGASACSAKFS
jgi:hypothetical protein